ncbi:MAG TPA: hypothetical protein PKD72_06790, partial [Gemmatales bacterium]|nr:hypothetical protein [Gemmatales bacterium]
ADNVKARELRPDGSWVRVTGDPNKRIRSQQKFLELAAEAASRIPSEPGILAPVTMPDSSATLPSGKRRRTEQRRDGKPN